MSRAVAAFLLLLLLPIGCTRPGAHRGTRFKNRTPGPTPQVLAVYEAWWGHPRHINIGYSSHDPVMLRKQIRQAKSMGITGFAVDWYGYREPFIDQSYALLQGIAGEENFHIAMMYDESNADEGATDSAIEDFKLFHKVYLAADAPGRAAYLTLNGRPVIFIFPKGFHTDWNAVKAEVSKWNPAPVLIDEYPTPEKDAAAIDGYYAWVQPGEKGWAADGSHWGEPYLNSFYEAMETTYPGKIVVGGAWASFDDSKASWGLNRHISPRCGQTYTDTFSLAKANSLEVHPMPFLLVETWNDYEEGTAVEKGFPSCNPGPSPSKSGE